MPQWGPFLAVVVVLTVLLLVLARQSQQLIREAAERDDIERDTSERGISERGISERDTSERDDAECDDTGRDGPSAASDTASGSVVDAPDTAGDRPSEADTPTAFGDRPGDEIDSERSGVAGGDPDAGSETLDAASEALDAASETLDAGGETIGTGGDSREPPGKRDSFEEPSIQLTSGLLLANVAATQGIVVVIVVVAAWYFSIPATAFGITAEPLAAGLPGAAVGIGFGLVLWIANELSTTLADAVGAAYDEVVRELLAPKSTWGWASLFVVVLPLIAVAEEVLFRAALIGVPATGFAVSPWLLAIGSSLAFALGHGAQGRVGIVVTGVLGLVLAAGYILTGSLLVVVVAHYVINAMEFFVHEFLDADDILPPRWASDPG